MPLKIPLGIADFKQIIDEDFYYVDKTLLIQELEQTGGNALLITRPHGFGKSLNLSMLKYFFEKSSISNRYLFEKTAIWAKTALRPLQGSFPVIYLSFASCNKNGTVEEISAAMLDVIAKEFERHFSSLESTLVPYELTDYQAIMERQGSLAFNCHSLFFLSKLLQKHYQKRVMVLIDDYDAPLYAAYRNGCYQEIGNFLLSLLEAVLKDNSSLARGILTGIVRTPRAGLFSGLNNLSIYSLLDTTFSDAFGFTPTEVDKLLRDTGLEQKSSVIKEWYNGYRCGKSMLYNPLPLLHCIGNDGVIDAYWSNTINDELIKKLFAQAPDKIKSDLERLINGQSIDEEIDEGLIFPGIENSQKAIWSLLLSAGYLTFTASNHVKEKESYTLTLPNEELKRLYRSLISSIMQSLLSKKLELLKESLANGNINLFSEILQEFTTKSMSVFDIPADEPERAYHLFVLCLHVLLRDLYKIKSNNESGYNRYDSMLIPYDKTQWGIILEFKKASSYLQESLEEAAKAALNQIENIRYAHELHELGIKKIMAYGVGCKGTKILVKSAIK